MAYARGTCLELRELIGSIVVAPRVNQGDPIHFKVRMRLATLTQPDPGRVSVAALVPREGIIRNHRQEEPLFVLKDGGLSIWHSGGGRLHRHRRSPVFLLEAQRNSRGRAGLLADSHANDV